MASPLALQPAAEPSRRATLATLPVTLLVQAAASAATLAPAVAAPALLPRLELGTPAVGVYIAAVYVAAMVSSQWGAAVVKRWGPIRTSQVALGLCAIGLLLVSLPYVLAALLGALLIGAGYGPITPASSHVLARTTPPHRYALVFSIKQTGVPVGGALAGALVPVMLAAGGVQWSQLQIAVLCLVGIALAQMLRTELDKGRDPKSRAPALAQLARPIRFVLANDRLRRLALCTLVFSAVQVCLTSYLVSFLTHDLSWTLVAAGLALAVTNIAGVCGRVLWGVLADRTGSARWVLFGLALVMALASVAMSVLQTDTSQFVVIVLVAVYGASAVGWNGVYLATVARLVPIEQAAAATSGSLFFTFFGVVLGPPLFGLIAGASNDLGIAYALLAVPLLWTLWTLYRRR
ncbi:MAG TPA: MFS transporter [Burkholderiaceae bacterium]|nr:MFS transporter [Burkholderiaceae bacterium]